jgi:hypothetical protein
MIYILESHFLLENFLPILSHKYGDIFYIVNLTS